MPLDFLDGAYRSHLGRLALAAGDLLAADAGLNEWCGGVESPFTRGRIHLPVHAADTPDGDWPMLLVYALSEVPDPKPAHVVDITGTIVVVALWDDLERVTLDDGLAGPESLAAYIRRVLLVEGAYHLKVPRYSNRPLVNSVLPPYGQARIGPELTKEQLGRVFLEQDEPQDWNPSGLRLELQMDYRYQVDRLTWTPAGFDPEE